MGDNESASYDGTYLYSFGVEHVPKEIKIHRKEKYHKKYLWNTSIQFDNVWILLYWEKVCTTLNYIDFLILASAFTEFILISAFASLLGILIGIASSAIGLKLCTITAEISC